MGQRGKLSSVWNHRPRSSSSTTKTAFEAIEAERTQAEAHVSNRSVQLITLLQETQKLLASKDGTGELRVGLIEISRALRSFGSISSISSSGVVVNINGFDSAEASLQLLS